jgi:hypothetical protein
MMSTSAAPQAGEEKIEVAHIRIQQAQQQIAKLGAFREADRLLTAWVDCASDYFEFDFEVTFIDGYVYRGRYQFWRGTRGRPSLSRYVRQAFARLQSGQAGADELRQRTDWSRYALEEA